MQEEESFLIMVTFSDTSAHFDRLQVLEECHIKKGQNIFQLYKLFGDNHQIVLLVIIKSVLWVDSAKKTFISKSFFQPG